MLSISPSTIVINKTYAKRKKISAGKGEKIFTVNAVKSPRLLDPLPLSPSLVGKENIVEISGESSADKNIQLKIQSDSDKRFNKSQKRHSDRHPQRSLRNPIQKGTARYQRERKKEVHKKVKRNRDVKKEKRWTPPMKFTSLAPKLGEQISLSDDDSELPSLHRYA